MPCSPHGRVWLLTSPWLHTAFLAGGHLILVGVQGPNPSHKLFSMSHLPKEKPSHHRDSFWHYLVSRCGQEEIRAKFHSSRNPSPQCKRTFCHPQLLVRMVPCVQDLPSACPCELSSDKVTPLLQDLDGSPVSPEQNTVFIHTYIFTECPLCSRYYSIWDLLMSQLQSWSARNSPSGGEHR